MPDKTRGHRMQGMARTVLAFAAAGVCAGAWNVSAQMRYLHPSAQPHNVKGVLDGPDAEAVASLPQDGFVATVARPVGRLRISVNTPAGEPGRTVCTGVLVAEDTVLTAHHCLPGWYGIQATAAWFDVDLQGEPPTNRSYEVELKPREASVPLDYVLLKVAGSPGLEVGVATVADRPARQDEPLLLVHYPRGGRKAVTRTNCRVYRRSATAFMHTCDTDWGSSGAPIFSARTGKLVGMHYAGNRQANYGRQITALLRSSTVLSRIVPERVIHSPTHEGDNDPALSRAGDRLARSLVRTALAEHVDRVAVRSAQSTERRVALVIGNAAYDQGPLRNPIRDLRAIAGTLRAVGFEVTALENASQERMKRAIFEFGSALRRGGGVGLFYFSGHGMQVSGRNWMVPVDARLEVERHVELEGVDVGRVLVEMESSRNRLNIVILDACRDNPFARSFRSRRQGLAPMDAPAGTLVAYATAPGQVAADGDGQLSPFTGALVKAIPQPGLKLEDVFKRARVAVKDATGGAQVPWEYSSLTGDFFFVPAGDNPSGTVAMVPPIAAPALAAPAAGLPAPFASAPGTWQAWGGAGAMMFGAIQALNALQLHREAWALRDSDPPRSRELEAERNHAFAEAILTGSIGLALIMHAGQYTNPLQGSTLRGPVLRPLVRFADGRPREAGMAMTLNW